MVDPGRVYRSAQPGVELDALIRRYRIGSILNLRGGSRADDWYEREVRVARERNVSFYDLPLSATRRPARRELLVLIDLLDRCPYPLLIHCKSGSDRTGLATALYRLVELRDPPEEALRAFSIAYGHVPLNGPQHLHEPLLEYGSWLKEQRIAHTPERFREWVAHVYHSDDPDEDAGVTPLAPGPRTRHRASLSP